MARVYDSQVLNGFFYILRIGSPWRNLPKRYGGIFRFLTVARETMALD